MSRPRCRIYYEFPTEWGSPVEIVDNYKEGGAMVINCSRCSGTVKKVCLICKRCKGCCYHAEDTTIFAL